MEIDKYVIQQLHNKVVLQQPVRMDNLFLANLNHHHPQDFFPAAEPNQLGGAAKECYVLTPRHLLYGTVCPDRRGRNGYWKTSDCTASSIFVFDGIEGSKRSLCFYEGEQDNGHKTIWKMIEYRLRNQRSNLSDHRQGRRAEWVICKVYRDFNEEDLSLQIKQMEIN